MNCLFDENKIDSVIRFFLYALIFWLPYSPAVVESCVIISLILWIFKRAMRMRVLAQGGRRRKLFEYLKCFKPVSSFLNQPIVFFVTICLLSVAGSAFLEQSLHNFLTKTLEWFIVYFLILEVFQTKKHIRLFIYILIFTSFSTALDSIVQFHITHKDIFLGRTILEGGRATAGFKTPNGLGGFLTLVVPLLSILYLDKNKFRLLYIPVFLALLWSLVITFSRGAWLGAVLGSLIAFVLVHWKRDLKLRVVRSVLLIVLVCSIFSMFILKRNSAEMLLRSTSQWRVSIWQESTQMIKDKILLGHGINTYMRVFQAYRKDRLSNPTYAHNCYIQLTAETGLLGLAGFLWIMIELFRNSLNKIGAYFKRDQSLAILSVGLLFGIFAFLVHSLFDTNFYSLQLSVGLWAMIGIQSVICKLLNNDSLAI